MNIYKTIISTYPELSENDFVPITGSILLKDDGDGIIYIAKWEYSEPIPDGLTLGKPNA